MNVAAWPSLSDGATRDTCDTATTASLAYPPKPTLANTRSPTCRGAPSSDDTSDASSLTRPTTSIPGTNGTGGLIW